MFITYSEEFEVLRSDWFIWEIEILPFDFFLLLSQKHRHCFMTMSEEDRKVSVRLKDTQHFFCMRMLGTWQSFNSLPLSYSHKQQVNMYATIL